MFIVSIIVGIALLAIGANILTDGASAIAKRLKVSDFLIGVTIVAVGTSTPELVVSLQSAIAGQAEVSIGNIVGSNIFNVYAILGITTLIAPLLLTRANEKRDIPIHIGASALLVLLALDATIWHIGDNTLSRIDGIVLLVFYGLFLWWVIRTERGVQTSPATNQSGATTTPPPQMGVVKAIVMVVAGLAGLIIGSRMFLNGSVELAHRVGLSEAVIGLVLVAAGTSLPELFATIVPALKGKSELALGNILGSNIANILLILGTSATIPPLKLGDIGPVDLGVMFSTSIAVLLATLALGRRKITRLEGFIGLTAYICYTLWLLGGHSLS
ncbi:MAG: calcium/sodium antiporter [Tidjanibacter sp.]|nr:calcium/sodium antiporter [Tidjanibacter sp.]